MEIRNLSEGFKEMVLEVYPLLEAASKRGIPIDNKERDALIVYLQLERTSIYKSIQLKVSDDVRGIHPPNGYVRIPPIIIELTNTYNQRTAKLLEEGKKVISIDDFIAKRTYHNIIKAGVESGKWGKYRFASFSLIDKHSGEERIEGRWCLVKDFNPNTSKQIIRYMKSKGHKVPVKLDGGETSEAKELERLAISTGDIFYDEIIWYRQVSKMLSNDIPNWNPNPKTGRVHTQFGFTPASGQLSSRSPNVQNCFGGDSELLTRRGFVRFDGSDGRGGVRRSDRVAQYNSETKEISFVEPLNVIEQEYKGELIYIHNVKYIDLLLTPDHECLLRTQDDKSTYKVYAKDYPTRRARQLNAGYYVSGDISYTPAQVVLIAALQADGQITEHGAIRFHLGKERKKSRLYQALDKLQVKFKIHEDNSNEDYEIVYISKLDIPTFLDGKKFFGDWILDLDKISLSLLAEEIFKWDGCISRNVEYFTSDYCNAEWVQILLSLVGKRAHWSEFEQSVNGSEPKARYILGVSVLNKDWSDVQQCVSEKIDYCGKVYCVEVPEHNIIVRRKGKVCITGNCNKHHALGKRFRKIITPPVYRDGRYAGRKKRIVELDYSGFHAIMLGREAESDRYINISRCDAHSWFTSYIIGKPVEYPRDFGKNSVSAEQFRNQLKAIKREYKIIRDTQAKPSILGIGLGLGPKKLYWMNRPKLDKKTNTWNGISSEKMARHNQGILKELLPELFSYQTTIKEKANRQTYLINDWGMIRWFFDVKGEDGEKAIAFNVQGNAHGMLRWVIRRLDMMRVESDEGMISPLDKYGFNNTIHDSLCFEPFEDEVEECVRVVKGVMETSCRRLTNKVVPEGLVVLAEATVGENWGFFDEKENPGGMKEW